MTDGPTSLRRPWRFLQLTLFMAAWMLLAPQLQTGLIAQATLLAFVLNSVLVTLWANPEWLYTRTVMICLWMTSLAASLIGLAHLPERWEWLAVVLGTAALLPLLALISVGMLRFVFRRRLFTSDSVFATVVVYVLIALAFERTYALLVAWNPQSLALPVAAAERAPHLLHVDLMYFSLITQASVGYGDILPVSETARMLAVMQAIVGQFYMAVIVAVFVGSYAARRQA